MIAENSAAGLKSVLDATKSTNFTLAGGKNTVPSQWKKPSFFVSLNRDEIIYPIINNRYG